MATSSTLPDVKDKLIELLTPLLLDVGPNHLRSTIDYSWMGADKKSARVFFGRMPDAGLPSAVAIQSEIPTIKGGRKQRQENYQMELTIWTGRQDSRAGIPRTVERDAFAFLAVVDGLLADNPSLGLDIQWARLAGVEILGGGPFEIENGYAACLLLSIEVQARLT